MTKSNVLVVALVVIALVAGAVVGTHKLDNKQDQPSAPNTSQNTQNTSPEPSNTTQGAVTGNIEIKDNMIFTPSQISVKKGEAVTWTNNDDTAHTVTNDSKDAGGPDSATIAPGATYTFTFTKTGSFQYHCEFHHEMRGTIVVN